MAYYTAVLTRSGGQWQLRPSDIDAPEGLADVSDAVRTASRGRGGLAIVEREDEWFAIVRVDGEDDPRIFVSDLPAARQGPFAVLFEDVDEWERPVAAGSGAPRALGRGVSGLGADAPGVAGPGGSDDEVDHEDDDAYRADGPAGVVGGLDEPASDRSLPPGVAHADATGPVDASVWLADEDVDADLGDDDLDDGLDEDLDDDLDLDDGGLGKLHDEGDLDAVQDPNDAGTGDVGDEYIAGVGATGSGLRSDVAGPGSLVATGGRHGGPAADSGVALAPAALEEVFWAGDLGVLEDYGLPPRTLQLIVEDGDPSAALLAIGERAGFADVIDEWH